MLFTACRVNEAVSIRTMDVYTEQGQVRPSLLIRKGNTKGKLATREIPVLEDLRRYLVKYWHLSGDEYLFPSVRGRDYIHPDTASLMLRNACRRLGIQGASTHSFRRTALTNMSNAGIPLRVIQEISGHRTLDELYKYLEVSEDQLKGAIAVLSTVAPVESGTDSEKPLFPEDFNSPQKEQKFTKHNRT